MSGKDESKIRNVWRGMKGRCSEYNKDRASYFDKNIFVCDEWKNSFKTFYKWAMSNGYKYGLHIDRIDNDLGYCPDNCRFVTVSVNMNNRSYTHRVIYKGEEYAMMDLLRLKGIEKNYGAIRGRLKRGYSIEQAIDTDIRKGNYK